MGGRSPGARDRGASAAPPIRIPAGGRTRDRAVRRRARHRRPALPSVFAVRLRAHRGDVEPPAEDRLHRARTAVGCAADLEAAPRQPAAVVFRRQHHRRVARAARLHDPVALPARAGTRDSQRHRAGLRGVTARSAQGEDAPRPRRARLCRHHRRAARSGEGSRDAARRVRGGAQTRAGRATGHRRRRPRAAAPRSADGAGRSRRLGADYRLPLGCPRAPPRGRRLREQLDQRRRVDHDPRSDGDRHPRGRHRGGRHA